MCFSNRRFASAKLLQKGRDCGFLNGWRRLLLTGCCGGGGGTALGSDGAKVALVSSSMAVMLADCGGSMTPGWLRATSRPSR